MIFVDEARKQQKTKKSRIDKRAGSAMSSLSVQEDYHDEDDY